MGMRLGIARDGFTSYSPLLMFAQVGEPIVAALKGSDKGYVKSPAKPTLDPASAGNPTDAELAAYSAAIVEYTLAASRWRVLEIVSNTVGGLVVVESV